MRLSPFLLFACVFVYHKCVIATIIGECGEVYLSVAAKTNLIEINWNFTCSKIPTRIQLYSDDPKKPNSEGLFAIEVLASAGYHVTNIDFVHDVPAEWKQEGGKERPTPGPVCLNYWVATIRNSTFIDIDCLKIEPTWMETNAEEIEDIHLSEMFIPGTHNSGCYTDRTNDLLQSYLMTQRLNIYEQLVHGIRYLDIRVGFYRLGIKDDMFFINHDKFQIRPILPVLRDIKLFLSRAPEEVIIIDIHRFPYGFKIKEAEVHAQFVNLLMKELGEYMVPKSFQRNKGSTLKDIWANGKQRLIVSYAASKISEGEDFLWEPLPQIWGNKQTSHDLKEFLYDAHPYKAKNPLWSAMAELTPTANSMIQGLFKEFSSLADLADMVNRDVTKWYRYDLNTRSNIVAMDFFLSTDIIDIAIRTNKNKHALRNGDPIMKLYG